MTFKTIVQSRRASIEKEITINDKKTIYGLTPLDYAVDHNNLKIAEFLIDHGANIHTKDNAGLSVLDRAIEKNHTKIIELLLDRGYDIGDTDTREALIQALKKRQQILTLAQQGKFAELKKLIQDGGYALAEAQKLIDTKYRQLCQAIKQDNAQLLQALHEQGVSLRITDDAGNTPLHRAVLRDSVKCINYLLTQGADIMTKNNARQTTFDLAVTYSAESLNALIAFAAST